MMVAISLCPYILLLFSVVNAGHLAKVTSDKPLLQAEKSVLRDSDVANYPVLAFYTGGNGQPRPDPGPAEKNCKPFPGDAGWPTSASWNVLNSTVGGRLVKPNPIAKVCYSGQTFNPEACTVILNSWSDSDLHAGHPSSIMSPLYQGLTCLPTSNSTSTKCTLGGYPVYVVNALSARDVQAAVNFARNTNIRLVVKNTGHDFSGKSSGAGSLSIRTHGLKGLGFISRWGQHGYDGPAFQVGAGVQAFELYAEAHARNLVVVGGEGVTVGWGGGYIQGGGHSPLSSILGMAADHVLEFEVVTADGRFVTANSTSHPDLFWSLRGGGGSTFGVIISTTVKAFPDSPVTISSFTFTASAKDLSKYPANTANDDFWAVIRSYFELFIPHADDGIYSYFNIFPIPGSLQQVFSMAPFFAPRKTVAQVAALLKPVIDKAFELNVTLIPNTTSFPGFHSAWQAGFPQESIGNWNNQIASRLFPRGNWRDSEKFCATFDAIRTQVSHSFLIGFDIAPTLAAGGNADNAVNPAWRDTIMHAISGMPWDIDLRYLPTIHSLQHNITEMMKSWRDVSPGAGAYLNEADINEPNFQTSFWGSKYARLYEIKQRFDPLGVFYAENAVGSEDWSTGISRLERLCRR